MRDREEFKKEMDNPFLNRLSKESHLRDVRNNAEPRPFFPRKKEDTRSDKSKAFQRKWLG